MIRITSASDCRRLGLKASGTRSKRGPNKLESDYAALLEARKLAGEIEWWGYEVDRLLIANGKKRAWFTPDFTVKLTNGEVEYHETKGFRREAAIVRLKVAAGIRPFRFVLVTREKGHWNYEEFGYNKVDRTGSCDPRSAREYHASAEWAEAKASASA